ncbi:MAG TPA: SpoIIE family protein phosphatase [Candidatus Binataceae bacterium]|jgi:adenylate cyclase|nr:SpoIIE family protein phosphatase [Candidatus Binataceae bacterium]
MTDLKSPSEARTESAAERSQTWTFDIPGRILAVAVLALLVAIRIVDPRLIATIRLRGFDLEQQFAPRVYQPLPVRIVTIDDHSLKQVGQWPWPRAKVAQLVDAIAAGHPAALGVDIIFAEQDRFSPAAIATLPGIPEQLAHELALLPPSGTILADAFRKVPTVLGMGFSYEGTPEHRPPRRVSMVRESGADPRPFLQSYGGLVRSVPELTAAARGQGVLAGQPNSDGIVRRVPLVVIGEGNLEPSLALEMLRVASGGSIGIVTGKDGVRGATVDDIFAPTDWRARAYPYFTRSVTDRYVSAADLLNNSFDPANLRHALVLLGVTGLGMVDVKQTPLGMMAGVEVAAQLIESMLSGTLLRRPAYLSKVEIAVLIAAGLVTVFVLPYQHPRVAGAIFAALLAALIAFEYAGFRLSYLLFDSVYPAAGMSIIFVTMLGASLRSADKARHRLAAILQHERESTALLEGELNAARAIQMGLLPQRFIGAPERPEVDIDGMIEPARVVGGDFYDFLMLDSRRLSFAIADVSGKGVPAALFMAMSKEVLRAATLSHGEALDQVFAEANKRISAVSNDMAGVGANMMFVTVFAGVLDVVTGKLAYVSAGHEPPFVLRPDCTATRLLGRGGPPLGSVDEFPYSVEQRQLAAGEMLLLYTDGVTEAEDRQNSFYGEARLEQVLASAPRTGAHAVVDFVREEVRHFAAGAEQADDITLLAVRWLGAAA